MHSDRLTNDQAFPAAAEAGIASPEASAAAAGYTEPTVLAVEAAGLRTSALGVALAAIAWVATGILTAHWMRRRGHEFVTIATLGVAFGPLLVPLARALRRRADEAPSRAVAPGIRGPGPLDVLVALHGPGDAVAALRPFLRLLLPLLGRVTVARAVDYEAALRDDWDDAKRLAALEVDVAAALLEDLCQPETVLVPGPPGLAHVQHARRVGYDLVLFAGMPDGLRRTVVRGPGQPAVVAVSLTGGG